jgi:hypothetical protein
VDKSLDVSPTPERAAQLYVYVLPFSSWTLLRNPIVLTNGCLRIDRLNTTNSRRQFFRLSRCREQNSAVLFFRLNAMGSNLELWLTTVDNSPLTADRVAGIQILSSTNLSLPFNNWTPECNSLDGCARMSGLSKSNSPGRFFRLLSAPWRERGVWSG